MLCLNELYKKSKDVIWSSICEANCHNIQVGGWMNEFSGKSYALVDSVGQEHAKSDFLARITSGCCSHKKN